MADAAGEALGQLEVEGTVVLASAPRDKVSLMLPGERYTAFTGRLLKLLDDGLDREGPLLTLDVLYQQLRRLMRAEGLAVPQQRGTGFARHIALGRNSRYTQPAASDANDVVPDSKEPETPWPPEVLASRYRLTQSLGGGALSDSFIAWDATLGRSVVVKVLGQEFWGHNDRGMRERLLWEARAASRMDHPSIVSVYDTGATKVIRHGRHLDVPWIVVQLIDGSSLRERLLEVGRLTQPESVNVIKAVLAGLSHGHDLGVMHGDIKPENILLSNDGTVLLQGYGLGHDLDSSKDSSTEAIIGSAQYLAPEVAIGYKSTPLSDLYSTACVLFEVLTGRPPFTGNSSVEITYKHFSEPPPSLNSEEPRLRRVGRQTFSIGKHFPPRLDQIVLRGLQKDPGARYPTALQFLEALDQFQCSVGPPDSK